MPDTDNWDMFAHTCRGFSFLYTVVMSRPTSFVEKYITPTLSFKIRQDTLLPKLLWIPTCIHHISHSPLVWQLSNLLFYAFIYVPLSIQAYKFVTLFCVSALFQLQIYLHTYHISNAGFWKHLTKQLKRISKHADQWRILIRSSRLAERYNAPLCTLPLDPTSSSGIATDKETDTLFFVIQA